MLHRIMSYAHGPHSDTSNSEPSSSGADSDLSESEISTYVFFTAARARAGRAAGTSATMSSCNTTGQLTVASVTGCLGLCSTMAGHLDTMCMTLVLAQLLSRADLPFRSRTVWQMFHRPGAYP